MGLKENISAVKQEIGAEEQFLESVIKGERFFKKYKKLIISAVVILVLTGFSYSIWNILNESRLAAANLAYSQLISNPKNSEALKTLKEKNERLYKFYQFQIAVKNNDMKVLKELSTYNADPVISDLSKYQLSDNTSSQSELLKNFGVLQEGFKLLQDDKVEAANLKFAQIGLNSPLNNIVKNLEHYVGKTKVNK